jgi:hypothetical protein
VRSGEEETDVGKEEAKEHKEKRSGVPSGTIPLIHLVDPMMGIYPY